MTRKFLIGSRPEGKSRDAVIVEVSIAPNNHGELRASFSGESYSLGRYRQTSTPPGGYGRYAGGQIIELVEEVDHFEEGWDAEKRDKLVEVWRRWHLNDMRMGCEHQRELGWRATHVGADDDKVGQPCPVCGYKFGSEWLYEELPNDVRMYLYKLIDPERVKAEFNRILSHPNWTAE